MFIIVGIMILFVFILLFYMVNLREKIRAQANIQKMTSDLLQSEAINFYTTKCLEDALAEGLYLLGQQGGYIYKDQPGSIILTDIDYVNYYDTRVAYLLEPNQYLLPPKYPCLSLTNPPVYCGFINNITLYPSLDQFIYGNKHINTLFKDPSTSSTIQAQLESYIENQTKECTNFTFLNHLPEFEHYTIVEEPLEAEVIFTEDDVAVILDYPITFSLPDFKPVTHILRFNSRANVRFKKIYNAISDMIGLDWRDLNYDMLVDTKIGYYISKTRPFSLIKDNATLIREDINIYDNLFIINDSKSELKGKPFIFQFARKNRYPVLDYIPKKNITSLNPDFGPVDIAVFENDTLTITPSAKDPDEDNLSYSYHGWKADFITIWNDTSHNWSYLSSLINYWHNSSAYNLTQRIANITLTHEDAGFHNTTVNVSDMLLNDWQIVRILVELILHSNPVPINLYDDVPDDMISIEDPIILDGCSSTWIVDPDANYTFTWKDHDRLIFQSNGSFQSSTKCIVLPSALPCQNDCNLPYQHSENIINMSANRLVLDYSNISLNVTIVGILNQTDTAYLNATVKQCLPHYNPYSYPYPYQQPGLDPFQADHTCCSEDGTILTGKECFNYTYYDCRPDLQSLLGGSRLTKEIYPATKTIGELPLSSPSPPLLINPLNLILPTFSPNYPDNRYMNDIYQREFIQLCGNRGNACSGIWTDIWALKKECKGPDISKGEDESCQGPAQNPSKCCNYPENPSGLCINDQCYNYNQYNNTFEKAFSLPNVNGRTADGICNNNENCCIGDGLGNYNIGGNKVCLGNCNPNSGDCDAVYNSRCVIGRCGAECSTANTYHCTDTSRIVNCYYWTGTDFDQTPETILMSRTRTVNRCTNDCQCQYNNWEGQSYCGVSKFLYNQDPIFRDPLCAEINQTYNVKGCICECAT